MIYNNILMYIEYTYFTLTKFINDQEIQISAEILVTYSDNIRTVVE